MKSNDVPVIDAHTHIFPEQIAKKAADSVSEFYQLPMSSIGTVSRLQQLRESSESGRRIVRQLVCSPAVLPAQTESINTFIGQMCAADEALIGFGTLHRDNADYETELDNIVQLGLKGVKFHFDFQQFALDDEKLYPIYRAIARRHLPVLFHMGDKIYDYSSPKRLHNVLKTVPELTVIAAHMGGYQHWQEAYELPAVPQLYFDLSSTLAFIKKENLREMFAKFGVKKFFFGSDFPMWNPYEELKRLEQMGLTKEEFQAVTYENFKQFMEEKCAGIF